MSDNLEFEKKVLILDKEKYQNKTFKTVEDVRNLTKENNFVDAEVLQGFFKKYNRKLRIKVQTDTYLDSENILRLRKKTSPSNEKKNSNIITLKKRGKKYDEEIELISTYNSIKNEENYSRLIKELGVEGELNEGSSPKRKFSHLWHNLKARKELGEIYKVVKYAEIGGVTFEFAYLKLKNKGDQDGRLFVAECEVNENSNLTYEQKDEMVEASIEKLRDYFEPQGYVVLDTPKMNNRDLLI